MFRRAARVLARAIQDPMLERLGITAIRVAGTGKNIQQAADPSVAGMDAFHPCVEVTFVMRKDGKASPADLAALSQGPVSLGGRYDEPCAKVIFELSSANHVRNFISALAQIRLGENKAALPKPVQHALARNVERLAQQSGILTGERSH